MHHFFNEKSQSNPPLTPDKAPSSQGDPIEKWISELGDQKKKIHPPTCLEEIEKNIESISAEQAGKLLYFLSKRRTDLRLLTIYLKTVLELISKVAAQKPPSKEIGNVLWATAHLHISWKDITEKGLHIPLTDALLTVLKAHKNRKRFAELKRSLISNALNAFSKHDLRSNDYKPIRDLLIEIALDMLLNMSNETFSSTLSSLSHLGCSWEKLDEKTQNNLIYTLNTYAHEFDLRTATNILWSLTMMGMPWEQINAETQAILKEKCITNCMNMFAQLEKEDQYRGVYHVTKPFIPLRQVQQMRYQNDWILDPDFSKKLDETLKCEMKPYATPESFQADVTRHIKRLLQSQDVKIEEEGAPLEIKPVDIFIPQIKGIIEIDGIHHTNNADLRPRDKFNQRLFENLGFTVVRINQVDWKSKRTLADKEDFLWGKLSELGLTRPEQNQGAKLNKTW